MTPCFGKLTSRRVVSPGTSLLTPVAPPSPAHHDHAHPPNLDDDTDATLEVVRFEDTPTLVVNCTPPTHRNITTTRGSFTALPLHIPSDTSTPIREMVADFTTSVCRAATPPVAITPPRRIRARPQPESVILRRSERLAKKSHYRATKPVMQAQNVLMRRLGLTSTTAPPDATSFQHFVDTFSKTLTVTQCEALDVLLPEVAPFVAEVESETLLA